VAVDLRVGIEKVDVQPRAAYKCASDKGVREVCDSDRVVIDVKHLIDVELLLLNHVNGSLLKSKDSHVELTVIHVAHCKLVSFTVLLYLVALDALVLLSFSHRLFKNLFVCF
jgi:hypothetical protein